MVYSHIYRNTFYKANFDRLTPKVQKYVYLNKSLEYKHGYVQYCGNKNMSSSAQKPMQAFMTHNNMLSSVGGAL